MRLPHLVYLESVIQPRNDDNVAQAPALSIMVPELEAVAHTMEEVDEAVHCIVTAVVEDIAVLQMNSPVHLHLRRCKLLTAGLDLAKCFKDLRAVHLRQS